LRQEDSLEGMESISDVTSAFEDLLMENTISESTLSVLERYVVLLYDRTSDLVRVNDAKKWLFTKKVKDP